MKKPGKVVMPVKGGWIAREAATGRFSEVGTERGKVSKSSSGSFTTVKESSDKRSAALKRLADR